MCLAFIAFTSGPSCCLILQYWHVDNHLETLGSVLRHDPRFVFLHIQNSRAKSTYLSFRRIQLLIYVSLQFCNVEPEEDHITATILG